MPIYTCPLSFDAPRVPVLTNQGITYDFVWIARSLLREFPNASHDPTTDGVINTLIYNRALKESNDMQLDEVLPLSNTEKIEVAALYMQLISRYPELKICGVDTLEGMQVLIEGITPAVQLAPEFEPNFVDADGRTSLYLAAKHGRVDIVRQLLMRDDARPNQGMTLVRLLGATPLMAAAEKGHVPVALILLADPRVEPNQAKADGATALFLASQIGHVPIVMTLLANQRVDPNRARINGATPLFIAAQKGNLAVVMALLDAGADINQANTNGETPFFIAVLAGHLTVAMALLDAGADINQANTDGETPLYTAILFGHFEVVQALMRQQHATMNHLPILSVTHTQHGYPEYVAALLSDETVRDYYLNQIIIKPTFMRDAFTKNPVFFTKLATHLNALWMRLREPANFNLSADEYRGLLRAILDSRQEINEALHHPLYTLFNRPQLQEPRGFSFFNHTTYTFLDDIQVYMDAVTEYNPMHNGFIGNGL